MRRTWFLTVFSARNRCAAISPLVCPPAISDMTSISRVDRPRLASSSTCARLMRPPVKSVRAAPKGGRRRTQEEAHTNDAAPSHHGVKTYLYSYIYTKKGLLKPPEPA